MVMGLKFISTHLNAGEVLGMEKQHWAIYGNTKLKRGFCDHCKCESLIIDNKFACCDKPSEEFKTTKWKKMCEA
jgi:hypothetical protein